MKILVTGGAGYIGSHTCIELLNAGHTPVVVDNFSNSKPAALARVCDIIRHDFTGDDSPTHKFLTQGFTFGSMPVYGIDLRDRVALEGIFKLEQPEAVIHFAGLKSVGESVADPWLYYSHNLHSTLTLVDAMKAAGCRHLVFSSSATVYGLSDHMPIGESAPLSAINPYGRTKLMIEDMLRDLAQAEPKWRIALLRYFNPVGAHISGRIGEDPKGTPNNLMPFITQVAVGRQAHLQIFGGDYPTPDGTGIRDYIHVTDLARGHVKALDWLRSDKNSGNKNSGAKNSRVENSAGYNGATAINLGTGRGYSVLEVVKAFEAESGRKIPYKIVARRPGDAARCYADPALAKKLLGWEAELDMNAMCRDAWRWQLQNPEGYA